MATNAKELAEMERATAKHVKRRICPWCGALGMKKNQPFCNAQHARAQAELLKRLGGK